MGHTLQCIVSMESADSVRERTRELERAVAALREGALGDRIGVYKGDVQIATDRITALEAETQRLRDQAASFGRARDFWTFAEAWLDVQEVVGGRHCA